MGHEARPYGTGFYTHRLPSVETLGYIGKALRASRVVTRRHTANMRASECAAPEGGSPLFPCLPRASALG